MLPDGAVPLLAQEVCPKLAGGGSAGPLGIGRVPELDVVDFTCRVESRVRFDARRTCAGPFMRAWTRAAADIQFTRGVNLLVGCADLIPVDLYLYLR